MLGRVNQPLRGTWCKEKLIEVMKNGPSHARLRESIVEVVIIIAIVVGFRQGA